jgi:hypothetical protein
MHHVREVDVVRQIVNPDPGYRLAFIPVFREFLDIRCVRRDELMAGATVCHCRNAGDWRYGSISVTVKAMNAIVAGMQLMVEGEWLDRRAVTKVERENVYHSQPGANSARSNGQQGNKP